VEFAWTDFLDWTLNTAPESATEQSLQLENGTTLEIWDSGVLVATPANPGPKDIILSCAVHGDETAPIEMVRDMAADIISGELVPAHRVMLLIANPMAINKGTRFVEENMNRLFSGAHQDGESAEHQRAGKIEYYVQRFFEETDGIGRQPCHYDLHTAIRDSKHEKFAVYPFTHGGPYKKHQLSFLRQCGVSTILLNQAPTTTFSYFSARNFNADAFTVELGKVRPFGENDMRRFADADQGFRNLIADTELELPAFDAAQHAVYDVTRTINRTQEAFSLNFPDDVANFTAFKKGDLIATDGEQELYIEADGESIIFPNAKVKIGQRALLLVIEIPAAQLDLV